jgi:hypothetical protein
MKLSVMHRLISLTWECLVDVEEEVVEEVVDKKDCKRKTNSFKTFY